jgi:hypothetical protein
VGDGLSRLRPGQRDLLAHWVPDAHVCADHSWGLVDTTVLELTSEQGRLVLEAGGVWAYGVGDEEFERFGHQLLRSLYSNVNRAGVERGLSP